MLEQAVQSAEQHRGVAVLTLPGDVGGLDLPKGPRRRTSSARRRASSPIRRRCTRRPARSTRPARSPCWSGIGAREARADVLAAGRAAGRADGADAQGQGGARARQSVRRRPDRADRQPRGAPRAGRGRPAADRRHRLPLLRLVSEGQDGRPDRRARRAHRPPHRRPARRDRRCGARRCRRCWSSWPRRPTARCSTRRVERYANGATQQAELADPDYDSRGLVKRVRAKLDNPAERIRPEALAAAVDRHAPDDAIFTTDTGMSTVWLSRFVTLRGTRRLLGSYNLGSMANAMPQALGAQALDRARKVVAFCGDGGLTMLLGDLLTAVAYDLPVMPGGVRQRPARDGQARAGAGRAAGVRHGAGEPGPGRRRARDRAARDPREDPDQLDAAVRERRSRIPGRCCSTSSPTRRRSRCRRRSRPGEAWGFAVAKLSETLESRGR